MNKLIALTLPGVLLAPALLSVPVFAADTDTATPKVEVSAQLKSGGITATVNNAVDFGEVTIGSTPPPQDLNLEVTDLTGRGSYTISVRDANASSANFTLQYVADGGEAKNLLSTDTDIFTEPDATVNPKTHEGKLKVILKDGVRSSDSSETHELTWTIKGTI